MKGVVLVNTKVGISITSKLELVCESCNFSKIMKNSCECHVSATKGILLPKLEARCALV